MRISKLVFLFLLPYFTWAQTLGYALEQIGGEELIAKKLDGAGVKIGIIDGGFLGANNDPYLAVHFDEDRIGYYKDFISPELAPYGGSAKLNDDHGTHVWRLIGGRDTATGIQHGLATAATYYLARTDHGVRETRQEERFLTQAMDEMIQLGVKVFNVSLGYTDGYNFSEENYSASQIDGRSTWITRSLDSLLSIHDVLVIVSAGNDGDSKWQVLSAPADSEKVITVGATKFTQWEGAGYSAKGPADLDFVKPDISCYSSNGTSYSAPIITGLAACIMQYDSTLTPTQIKELIIRSSHLYPYPNNLIGYGVPSVTRLVRLLDGQLPDSVRTAHSRNDRYSFAINTAKDRATVYHKSGWRVIKKASLKLNGKVKIKRPPGVTQSTILIGKQAFEIVWD